MKSIAAAVLMIAVSAWGQTPADSWPDKFAPFCLDGYHVTARDANGTVLRCAKGKPKPHKPKPSVKKEIVQMNGGGPCGEYICECKPTDPPSAECWRPRDKAAVPVDRYTFLSGSSIMCDGWITNDKTHPCDPAGMVVVYASDDSSVVKLNDSEYSHLQQLRSAVVEEEKRLAVKYGADSGHQMCDMGCVWMKLPDRYEYHGQFLLIEKGK